MLGEDGEPGLVLPVRPARHHHLQPVRGGQVRHSDCMNKVTTLHTRAVKKNLSKVSQCPKKAPPSLVIIDPSIGYGFCIHASQFHIYLKL